MTVKSTEEWAKPQLIALGKGQPEENVLASCKVPGLGGSGSFPCCRHTTPECQLDSKS